MTKNSPPYSAPKRRKIPKGVWVVGAMTLVGAAGWAVYEYLIPKPFAKLHPQADKPQAATTNPVLPTPKPKPRPQTRQATDNIFPLMQGMYGQRIKTIQRGLNAHSGAKLVIDGDWGPKTQAALVKAGVKTPIDTAGFARMLTFMKASDPYGSQQGQAAGPSAPRDPNFLSLKVTLGNAVRTGDARSAIGVLRQLRTTRDYQILSTLYQREYVESVRKTVVTALLSNSSRFTPEEKTAFRAEFFRMGLSYDRSRDRWSL